MLNTVPNCISVSRSRVFRSLNIHLCIPTGSLPVQPEEKQERDGFSKSQLPGGASWLWLRAELAWCASLSPVLLGRIHKALECSMAPLRALWIGISLSLPLICCYSNAWHSYFPLQHKFSKPFSSLIKVHITLRDDAEVLMTRKNEDKRSDLLNVNDCNPETTKGGFESQ